MDVQNPALIRTLLLGLANECPRGDSCSNCHLLEKRRLPYADKKEWIRSLQDDELCAIYAEHCRCIDDGRSEDGDAQVFASV